MTDTVYATIVFEDPGSATAYKTPRLASDGGQHYKARRPHTKSRKGCNTCKTRHLKCDERQPYCGQCIYGHRTCTYRFSPLALTSVSVPVALPVSGTPSHPPSDSLNGYSTGISETWEKLPSTVDPHELLSHFTHTTHRIWVGGPSCQRILQHHVPRLAVEAPYLRFAVLSFSAFHLATLHPETSRYGVAGAVYYTYALQSYCTVLHRPAMTEADALFACAILLSMIAYKNSASSGKLRVSSADKDSVLDITGLRAMAGCRVLKGLPDLQAQLRESVVLGQCESDGVGGLQSMVEYAENLATVERLERFCRIDDVAMKSGGVYDAALNSLRRLMLSEVGDGVVSTYFFFTRGFDRRFLALLERKDPRSLLLLCYWYALGTRIGQWWMAESARVDGMKVLVYLRKYHCTDMQGLLEFPSACLEPSLDGGLS